MRVFFLALGFALLGATLAAAERGVLLLAHGGNKQWNKTVDDMRVALNREGPAEIALGMADAGALQRAIDALERRGVTRIVAVPLFVHSSSEVLEHTRYLLGLREQPSRVLRDALASMPRHAGGAHGHHAFSVKRVTARAPIAMTKALDDHALVADVLMRRARALSRDPAKESVILVGHGPVDDHANEAWLATMGVQAARVLKGGGFRSVSALTIRDDSPPETKGPALEALRARVREAARDGRTALVVPYLIARGGIEAHIVDALKGLDYRWDGKTLCPDAAILKILSERSKETP